MTYFVGPVASFCFVGKIGNNECESRKCKNYHKTFHVCVCVCVCVHYGLFVAWLSLQTNGLFAPPNVHLYLVNWENKLIYLIIYLMYFYYAAWNSTKFKSFIYLAYAYSLVFKK